MYSRPLADNATSSASGSPKPAKSAPSAASSFGKGTLAKRNRPSGSASQRRCTSPNSQLSPRLSKRIIKSRTASGAASRSPIGPLGAGGAADTGSAGGGGGGVFLAPAPRGGTCAPYDWGALR